MDKLSQNLPNSQEESSEEETSEEEEEEEIENENGQVGDSEQQQESDEESTTDEEKNIEQQDLRLNSIKFDSKLEAWKHGEIKKGARLKTFLKKENLFWEKERGIAATFQTVVSALNLASTFTHPGNRQHAFDEIYNMMKDVPRFLFVQPLENKMSLLQHCVFLGIGSFFGRLIFLLDRFQLDSPYFLDVRRWWLTQKDILGNNFLHTLAASLNSDSSILYIKESKSFFEFIQVSPYWFGKTKLDFEKALNSRNASGKTPAQMISNRRISNFFTSYEMMENLQKKQKTTKPQQKEKSTTALKSSSFRSSFQELHPHSQDTNSSKVIKSLREAIDPVLVDE